MAQELLNPGHGVDRAHGSNFSTNKVEEIGAINNSLSVFKSNTFIIENYDYIALTYVSAGDGAGEIETAIYKTGGASGDVVGTLTLAYNSSNKIISVIKT